VIRVAAGFCHDPGRGIVMPTNQLLTQFSNEMADAIAAAAPGVVQVHGRRRPASGVVYADAVVVTMVHALGGEDGLRVRRHDAATFDAELAGWDPATSLAVLRVQGLGTPPASVSQTQPRVGHVALAVARSWSNALTASSGIVSVIGGPLRTGRRRAIDEVIRVTAPMHDGFAGGALLDVTGGLVGIATATAIRGLGVVIPASIAWRTAEAVLRHGRVKRGYLGLAGQRVDLASGQSGPSGPDAALLVVAVTAGSPAAEAGVLVGDLILEFDGVAVASPEDLMEALVGDRVGKHVAVRVLRGSTEHTLRLTVGERGQ
jgi:S1-C subfamily serine protease